MIFFSYQTIFLYRLISVKYEKQAWFFTYVLTIVNLKTLKNEITTVYKLRTCKKSLNCKTIFSVKNCETSLNVNENQWNSMNINEKNKMCTFGAVNKWKSMKIHEDQWRSMKINENQWKSMNISKRPMKINENQWNAPPPLHPPGL